jgi:hypothetical protein
MSAHLFVDGVAAAVREATLEVWLDGCTRGEWT